MALCEFCNKWMEKGTGKRPKRFCDDTCRSNYWYGKNKKGKPREDKLENEIKFVTRTPASYDVEKATTAIADEPSMWQEPNKLTAAQIESIMFKYLEDKMDCRSREEHV